MRLILAALALTVTTLVAQAEMAPREGWSVTPTTKGYDQLIADVKAAAKANKMGVVTQAGPTGAAKSRGITIPGNRVIGLFNNVYAVNILNLSTGRKMRMGPRRSATRPHRTCLRLTWRRPARN